MSTDTKIKTLIFNKLTQEQYNNADRVPTEFYLTPDTSIDSSEKGAANGVASLGTNGKVPTEQIPAATTSTLGGVKPDGTTITVTEDGVISAAISGEVVATKAELQALDSGKADTSLSNTTPSQSFKEMSVGWGMPDYTSGIALAGTSFICPSAGFVVMHGNGGNSGKAYINGSFAGAFSISNADSSANFFVSKNDVITFNSGYSFGSETYFYPLKGVN